MRLVSLQEETAAPLLHVMSRGEGGRGHAKKQASTRDHLDLVSSASKTVGNKHLLFNPPSP